MNIQNKVQKINLKKQKTLPPIPIDPKINSTINTLAMQKQIKSDEGILKQQTKILKPIHSIRIQRKSLQQLSTNNNNQLIKKYGNIKEIQDQQQKEEQLSSESEADRRLKLWFQIMQDQLENCEEQWKKRKKIILNFLEVEDNFNDQFQQLLSLIKPKLKHIKSFFFSLPKRSIEMDAFKQMNIMWSKLPNLQYMQLSLTYSRPKLSKLRQFSQIIQKMPLLIYINLDLSWNKLSPQQLQIIMQGMKCITQLKAIELNLNYNEVSNEGCQYISDCIFNLKQLIKLNLSLVLNEIQDKGMQAISESIAAIKSLHYLCLNFKWNQVSDQGIFCFASALELNEQLHYLLLDLYQNACTNEGIQFLGNSLSKLQHLNFLQLDIYQNKIQKDGFQYLTNQLTKLPTLIHISLSYKTCMVNENQSKVQISEVVNNNIQRIQSNCAKRRLDYYRQLSQVQYILYQPKLKLQFRKEVFYEILEMFIEQH